MVYQGDWVADKQYVCQNLKLSEILHKAEAHGTVA